jgi:fido (protein-threonine AMPylation protein)
MSANCPPWDHPNTEKNKEAIVAGMAAFHLFIRRTSRSHILDHGDLKTWHRRIFVGSVPLAYYAGEFRSDDTRYPCLRVNNGIGSLPGAPFSDVPRLMQELSGEMTGRFVEVDRYVGTNPTPADRARWVVMLAALYAGKFIRIHPFLNGNGRISRLIANYVLGRYGYPPGHANPYPRPAEGYAEAGAAAMVENYNPMFHYLLTAFANAVT